MVTKNNLLQGMNIIVYALKNGVSYLRYSQIEEIAEKDTENTKDFLIKLQQLINIEIAAAKNWTT